MKDKARPLAREDVIAGFRSVLGRDPESEDVIVHHQSLATPEALRQVLRGSDEFLKKKLTREQVIAGFQSVLGRNPESEEIIAQHQSLPTPEALRDLLRGSDEFRRKQLTREQVIAGFRWILGRDPESEEVIRQHQPLAPETLRDVLLNSEEFLTTNKFVRFKEKWILTPVYGNEFHMWIDLHDRFVSYGCLVDDYEPVETKFMRENVARGGNALDIGANVGWHTLGLARALGPEGHVFSFEPRRDTHAHLARTIAFNALDDRITLHSCGLWHEDATLGLHWDEGTDNPGGSFVVAGGDATANQTVSLKRLDDLVSDPIDFIKIDVEGAEPRVFQGGAKLIDTNRPTILSEILPRQLSDVSGCTPVEYISQMAGLGYECRLLEAGHYGRRIDDFPNDIGREVTNVVFVERGKSLIWPNE